MSLDRFEYTNLTQRVIASYRRLLVPKESPAFSGSPLYQNRPDAYGALHDLFSRFLERAFDAPSSFGFPEAPDLYVGMELDGKKLGERDLQPKFKKVRDQVDYIFQFLELLGRHGEVSGNTLSLDPAVLASFFDKKPRVKEKILQGMAECLAVDRTEGRVTFPGHPRAAEALVDLLTHRRTEQGGSSKKERDSAHLSRFNFLRLDLASISSGSMPDMELLYPAFPKEQVALLRPIHQFFQDKGYGITGRFHGSVFGWNVIYQGRRSSKSSPLFQIEYDERHRSPLRLQIKCAASNRIVPVLHNYSQALQTDFTGRTHTCGGADCGWCKKRKGLSPTVLEVQGEKRTICWHTRSEISSLDERTLDLVKEYELMHSRL